MSRRIVPCVALALALLALPAAASAHTPTKYYLSLGDSYAQGVQPLGPNQADIATNQGFTDDLYPKVRKLVPGLKLVKLGCGGATTTSLIDGSKPCKEPLPYASTSRSTSQLTYAADFMRKHRGRIALVTISIGGNDFANCRSKADLTAITTCVTNGIATMKANLPAIAKTLRKAAGKKAVIVGSTYPDVVLGSWVTGATGMTLAQASVPIFQQQVNPALKGAYAKQKIGFVDATTAFGSYIPFSQTTTLAPFGVVPQSVANICSLGWYCVTRPDGPDIHLRPAGYQKLAGLYLTEVKKRL
jgi:lysophospholipase L1-like esterase